MSSSGFFMRSSMAQFDSVDFNCATTQAALLPITVDLAGHRIKKQAQPFAAPGFLGGRHSQAAVISCVVGDFPVPLSTPTIASPRGHHASLSRPARLSLAQGLNGQTEAGYISSSCPILLETCRPFPSITAAKNRSLRITIAFSTCAGSRRVLLFCFPKRQKNFLLSDGKRGRSRNQGRTTDIAHAFSRPCFDFSKAVTHIINTLKDNS